MQVVRYCHVEKLERRRCYEKNEERVFTNTVGNYFSFGMTYIK
jgi:hypothetical protein